MADEEVQKLSDDTLEQLEQVRKGKPRKFVMICKGAKILGLVVFKKGTYEQKKTAAKKEAGTGVVVYGVIEGRGPNINFKIPRAEFDKEPVKSNILRTFLADEAEYKAQPIFEIVSELGPVLDSDDPLVQRFTKLQEKALAACETHPDRAGEINAVCLAIGKHFDADEQKEAEDKLAALEKLLSSLGPPATGGSTASQPQQTPPPADPRDVDKIASELKRLQPEVEVMLKAGVGDGGLMKRLLDGIAADRQGGDLQAALRRCSELENHLKTEWDKQHDEAEKRIETILSGSFTDRAGDVEKIKTVFGFADERAGAGRYGSALVALSNVRKLLDAAETQGAPKESDVIESGLVESRKKFVEIRWQAVLRDVHLEVDKLRDAISIAVADEPPNELADEIQDYINDFCDELNTAIFTFKKSGNDDRKPVERAIQTIKDYRAKIPNEPMIQHLNQARAALGIEIDVAGALLEALKEIEARLEEKDPVGAS